MVERRRQLLPTWPPPLLPLSLPLWYIGTSNNSWSLAVQESQWRTSFSPCLASTQSFRQPAVRHSLSRRLELFSPPDL